MALITKSNTFTAGATIIASQHNDNFDTIYSEFNGSISNANISASAAIAASKLNLSTIAQAITFTGNNTFSGTTIANLGTVTTADINGGTIDGVTIGASSAPTVTDLGSVATADINGGTIDGVTIGGASTVTMTDLTMSIGSDADGDVYYRASNKLARLAKGTAGQVLTMNSGATAPEWGGSALSLVSASSWTTATTSGLIAIEEDKLYRLVIELVITGADSTVKLQVNSSSVNYEWAIATGNESDGTALSPTEGADDTSIDLSNGGSAVVNTGDRYFACLDINTNSTPTTERIYVLGQYIHSDQAGTGIVTAAIGGRWEKNESLDDIEINTSTDSTGNAYLYEYATS